MAAFRLHPVPATNPRLWLALLVLATGLVIAPRAGADPVPDRMSHEREYLQYGLAFAAEAVASPGDVCPSNSDLPCILGSGGGVGVRVGYRARSPWYLGGAYEFSSHDSSTLLRLAILQQFRFEGRYYFDRGQRTTAFVTAALGLHLFGGHWRASTGGGLAAAGAGVEFQLSSSTTIGCIALYRTLIPRAWTDDVGARRADRFLGFGLAHLIGIELTLEIRDQMPRF